MADVSLLAGRYRFDGLLGSGGFGRVVRVRDEAASGERRAIKGVPSAGGERLVWEGETLFGLSHPRLVRVHELLRLDADAPAPFGFRAGSMLLVEGFVDGRTADRALADHEGEARVARALDVADDVLSALSALHARGLAHGDVKSGNVLVGEDGRATLIDLGLCQPFGRNPTAVGTPRAMAPEAWLGVSSPATDLYSLGVMLLELLGAAPRRAESASEPTRPGYVPAPAIEALDAAVPDAVRRALAELVDASLERRPSTARGARSRLQLLPQRSLTAVEAVDAGAPGPDERAASVARLPWHGPREPVAELAEALEHEPIVVVGGAPGSGRTRLVEEAVLRFQLGRAASARTAFTLVRASRELLVDEPSHPTLFHVEGATEATVDAARRLLRSAGIAGVELRFVLEAPSLSATGARALSPARLGVEDVASLVGAALAEPVSRDVALEMHARSGGRAGTLCRALAAGLRSSVDFARRDAVALLPWGDVLAEPPSAAALGALWRIALAGGIVPASAVEAGAARELVAAGIAYVTLDGRVGIEPDLAARARLAIPREAREDIVRDLARADLDPVARGYVRITGGDVDQGVVDLAAWSSAALARGEPGRVVERVGPLLDGTAEDALAPLRLLVSEADRRLGRYDRAEARLARVTESGAAVLARAAELARLRGDVPRARAAAERAVADEENVEAALVLARLDLDRGAADAAMSRLEAVGAACDESVGLRARRDEVRALVGMARGSLREAERIAAHAFDEALRAGATGPAARLATVVGSAILGQGRPALALPAFERGVSLADDAGELHLGATARLNLGLVRLDLGVIGPGRESLEGSARTLARLGRDADVARALYNLAHAALLTADVESARRFAALARASADRAGDVTVSTLLSLVEGDVSLREGRFGEAAQILLRAAECASALAPTTAAQLLSRASPLLLAAGRDEDAQRILDEAERYGDGAAADVAIARVRLALHRGDLPSAIRGARELARVLAEAEAPFEQRVRASLAVIDAHDASGHRDLAQAERSECRRLLDQAFRHLDPAARRRLRQLPSLAKVLASAPSVAPPDDPARWRALATDAASLLGEHRSSRLAEHVLRLALSTSGAERAYLVEREVDGAIRVVAAASPRGQLTPGEREQLSRSICRRGFETGRPMATSHADVDERLRASESVQTLALRSVAFVPMPIDGTSMLGLYIEDRQRPSAFGDEDLALLTTLGALSARAIAAATQRRRERKAARRLAIEQRSLRRELDKRSAELDALRTQAEAPGAFHGVIARSPAMLEVMRLARRVARAAVPVFVHGESGTGKELIARAIHVESPRAPRPFIAENCGAIPETLLESALFGHVKGAFTGADRDRTGLFEAADGGTLFLDEIGEMSPSMQVRLLRILEDGQVRRVGSTKSRHVDVRIVAASHRDLAELVERGVFRQDLFFRLAVVRIDIPPLRERVEDVPLLVAHFLEKHGSEGARFSRAAMDRMVSHAFPGNVRELENEVRRAIALSDGEIRPEHLSLAVRARTRDADGAGGARLRDQVDALERRLIEEALERHAGNQSRAAEALGVSRYGLQKMLTRLGLR